MPNYLIGYVDPEKNKGHEDPIFGEFTYGDIKENGKKLFIIKKRRFFIFP